MKGRLITNAVLSALIMILQIVGLVVLFKSTIVNQDGSIESFNFSIGKIISGGILLTIGVWVIPGALAIMGIVTLAMQKSDSARGSTIASGILSLISIVPIFGFFVSFANIIVSSIAAKKAV